MNNSYSDYVNTNGDPSAPDNEPCEHIELDPHADHIEAEAVGGRIVTLYRVSKSGNLVLYGTPAIDMGDYYLRTDSDGTAFDQGRVSKEDACLTRREALEAHLKELRLRVTSLQGQINNCEYRMGQTERFLESELREP
jgi:hypothetical protein